MKVARRAARRDDNEPEIVDAITRAGGLVWKLDTPVDLLVYSRPRKEWVVIEVKSPKGKLKPSQERFFKQLPGGAPAYVVRTVEEAVAVVRG